MVDTRAGRWMVIVHGRPRSSIILAAFVLWGPAEDASFDDLLADRHAAARDAAAGHRHHGRRPPEWTQRTGLVTFTPRAAARPRRARQGAGAPSHWAWSSSSRSPRPQPSPTSWPAPATWDLDAAAGAGLVLALLIYVLQGVAFGLLFLNTPVAHRRGPGPAHGLDHRHAASSARSRTSGTLDRPGLGHAVRCSPGRWRARTGRHLGTGVGVWVLLPLAIGTWRVLTREVK